MSRAVWPPSPQEVRLLRAGLWEPAEAMTEWSEWRRHGGDLDTIDYAGFGLLPLIYRNLEHDLDDPDTGRLKGIYRRTWVVNQMRLQLGVRAVRSLDAAGVESLLLKGAALAELAYRDPGARPMADIDVAVPIERVPEAVAALGAAGFAADADAMAEAGFARDARIPGRLMIRHSQPLADAEGEEIDLHGAMLWRPGLEDEFWAHSVDLRFGGIETRALCPPDQLLHVCIHGAGWKVVHPIRWVADAFKVLGAAGTSFDWDRLVEMSWQGRFVAPIRESLEIIATELRVPVPAEVTRRLAAMPVPRSERRAHEAMAQPPSLRRALTMFWFFWEKHRAEASLRGGRPGPLGFVRHMQEFWGLGSVWEVPAYAARRLLRKR